MVTNRPIPAVSRRVFLRRAAVGLAAASASAGLLGCSGLNSLSRTASAAPAQLAPEQTATAAVATPAPTPRPVPPEGRWERVLQPGERSETLLQVRHSGRQGPTVMILGGVHGNEPGGWLAAEELLSWEPAFGSRIVMPRANTIPTRAMVRTYPELGDLNRLYPGDPNGLPMERIAADIIDVAREFNVKVLLDMHESWAFYVERSQNGTAFLGQTISSGQGPGDGFIAQAIAERANAQITVRRDLMQTRNSNAIGGGPDPTPTPNPNQGRSTSSLGIGRYVPGLTPILCEMGQIDQTVARRIELHLLVAQSTLELQGVL